MGVALAGGLAALILTLLMAPVTPSFAEEIDLAASAAAEAPASSASTSPRSVADRSAPGPVASATLDSRTPALAVPEPVPSAAVPDEAPSSGTADDATAPSKPSTDTATPSAPERFVTILYRTSPGTAGTVNPHEERVRSADGAGLGGSVATPLEGYVCIGWYNGSSQVSPDAQLTRDEALAGVNRDASGSLAPTTFIARFARPSASLKLTTELASEPANGRCFVEGETVTFRATVANEGNVTLSDITFSSDLAAFAPVGSLAPGQSQAVEWSHVVTAEDARNDVLAGTVSARGVAPEYDLVAVAGPEGITAQTGTLPAGDTYVLYGAYPADGGSVSRSESVIDSLTGAGLEAVTAEPKPGYVFEGWYEDDERISTNPVLSPETATAALNRGRAAYAPTLFLAHFTKEESPTDPGEPGDSTDPEQPGEPDEPETPGETTSPEDPSEPGGADDTGAAGDAGSAVDPGAPGQSGDSGDASAGDTPSQPSDAAESPAPSDGAAGGGDSTDAGPDTRKATAANGAPSIPPTGDDAPALAALALVLAALATSALVAFARHRAG